MITRIGDLRLPERYTTALREAVAFIHERYEPIGIVVAGSIIRGTPDATSDLDLVVAHDAPWRQRAQRVFGDVPAEIFVNPPFQIRRTFRSEATEARPILAHMLATGVILDDPTGLIAELITEARATLDAGPQVTEAGLLSARYMIASTFEDAEDIRERDPERAAAMLIEATLEATRLHFRQSGRWHPREKDLLQALDVDDPELGALARRAIRAVTSDERFEAAREIVRRVTGATGFFAWDSLPEPLAPDPSEP